MERWNHVEMSLYVAQLPWHPVVRKYIEDHEEILRIVRARTQNFKPQTPKFQNPKL